MWVLMERLSSNKQVKITPAAGNEHNTMKKSEWLILIGLLMPSFTPSIGGVFRLLELGLGITLEFMPKNPRVQSFPVPVVFCQNYRRCINDWKYFIVAVIRSQKENSAT